MAKKFESTIGLKPVYSTKDPNGNPATKGEEFAQITRDNYEIIEKSLSNAQITADTAVKNADTAVEGLDTKADGLYVDRDNKLWLKSGNKTISMGIELPAGGILNVSKEKNKYDYATKSAARSEVKDNLRYRGQVITYQLSTGQWVLDLFVGDSVATWANDGSWRNFVTTADLSGVNADISTLKTAITGLDSAVKSKMDGFYTYEEDGTTYLQATNNGNDVGDPVALPAGGGGGGGTGITMRVRVVGASSFVAGEGVDAPLKYNFTSVESDTGDDTGEGTYTVTVNGLTVSSGVATQGENSFNLKGYIFLGTNIVKVRVVDGYGNARTISYTVQVASLMLTSTFADDAIYNTSPVPFRYTIIGEGNKTIRFVLNGTEIASDVTDTSGRQLTKNLTGLRGGYNTLRVFAESSLEGSSLKSNELYFEFVYADNTVLSPVIAVSFNQATVDQFSVITIPYIVFNPNSPTANVAIRVNNRLVSQLDVARVRQYFTYQVNENGILNIQFTSGATTRSLSLNVKESSLGIREETADLMFKVTAIGKSNSSPDRNSWDNNGYSSTFSDFTFSDEGWQLDDDGNSCLKLISDSKLNIGIKPFINDILITGSTLTVEYSTANVVNPAAVLMSCMYQGIGVEFTASTVTLKSSQTILTATFDSSNKISISLVIQKLAENRLMYLFIDGIASGTMQFPNSDNFTQAVAQTIQVSTGGRACQLMLYTIRWYKNSLNFDQILNNYIFDIEDLNEKTIVYTRNQIIDAYGNVDYNNALKYIPCITYIGDLPNYKGDKKNMGFIYEDDNNPKNSFSAQIAQVDVQGTSSQFYPRKNYKITFKNGLVLTETGEPATTYSIDGTQLPTNVFCMKTDFAESSSTHNIGIAVLIDQALKDYGILTPPQKTNPLVRTTVYGRPCLAFHKQTAGSAAEFLGKGNFNHDKASENVFGFTTGMECVEFKNNTSKLCLFKSDDFTNWTEDLEFRYPDGGTNITNIKKLFTWIVSCIGNPTKFKSEAARWFDVPNLVFYGLLTEVLVMTDQRAKNQFLTTYGEKGSTGELIWRFIFYDNDTALGINNEGLIAFNPYVEELDKVGSGFVWNGWDSELWRLVSAAFSAEIKTMYQQLRQRQLLSAPSLLAILQTRQSDSYCELIYNKDGLFKYIEPLISGFYDYSSGTGTLTKTGEFLYALQGSRSRHRQWYVSERFRYMDGKYDAGSHINDYASMRLYTPATWGGVAPNPNFDITMGSPGYVRILFGSSKTAGVRGAKDAKFTVNAPSGITLNDTETIVYGISAVKSLGDLSGKYIGTVDISKAYTLEDLTVGSTKAGYQNLNLKSLSTGENAFLKTVNVSNCPNLTQALDFSKCYSLETIEARGSGITGFSLPAMGVLKTANLPKTFAAVIFRNQPNLTNLTFEGYANVNTIIIENTPKIDGYALAKTCIGTADNKLSKVRLIGIDTVDSNSMVLNAISLMTGEDENGLPTDRAVVTGKIHINSVTQGALDRFIILFPNLVITYSILLDVIDFQDNIVRGKLIPLYDSNKDGEISSSEVLNSTIAAGLFSASGAKAFNEAHYWLGSGSVIDNCDTLEELSVTTGNFSYIQNLPALNKLTVRQGVNDITASIPLLNPNFLRNVYGITKFTLSGRYVEGELKGVILAKTSHPVIGQYYYWCLPLRTFENIVVKELLYFNDNILPGESTYAHNNKLKSLTIRQLMEFSRKYTTNLETLNIEGFTENYDCVINLYDLVNKASLKNVYIKDTNGGTKGGLNRIYVEGNYSGNPVGGITNIIIDNSVRSVGQASIYLTSNAGVNILDMGENFVPVSFTIQNGRGSGNWPLSGVRVIIIRYTGGVIPIGAMDAPGGGITAAYVPDALVDAYKAASNWSANAKIIYPLSTYNS